MGTKIGLAILMLFGISCTGSLVTTMNHHNQQVIDTNHLVECVYEILVSHENTENVTTGSCFAVSINLIPEKNCYSLTCITAKHIVRYKGAKVSLVASRLHGSVITNEDTLTYEVYTIDSHPTQDIAVLKAYTPNVLPVCSINLNKIYTGQKVLCMGYPLSLGLVISEGSIGHYNRSYGYQISAPATLGNSGGPIIDLETMDVIGLTSYVAHMSDPSSGGRYLVYHIQYFLPFSVVDLWLKERGISWRENLLK